MFKELMQQVATYKGTVKKEYATHAATVEEIKNKYSPAYSSQLIKDENKNYSQVLSKPRAEAKKAVAREIGKARRYIKHQLSHIDSTAINEIRSLQGIHLSETDIAVLQQKYSGSYWSQKALNSVLNGLLPPTAQIPDISPDVQIALLDRMEKELNFAIDNYDGREVRDSSAETVAVERIMSDFAFNDYAGILNQNPVFCEEQIENFYRTLSEEEDRVLYKTFFKGLNTDFDREKKAAEMVQYGFGERLERSGRFSKYLPEDYERVTGCGVDPE